jgi:L-ribulose-5-phosphate 3-epimerase
MKTMKRDQTMREKTQGADHAFFGIYEKALPAELAWEEKLTQARDAGYDFMEFSIDESDEKLERLQWDKKKVKGLRETVFDIGIPLLTMCLSANRRFPIGSPHASVQKRGLQILEDALWFAFYCGIRIIQVAGYDVNMDEKSTPETRETFGKNLEKIVRLASSLCVTLAIENVDVDFADNLEKIMVYVKKINSPWLKIYPDIGNLTAMNQDVSKELILAKDHIVAVHAKDTLENVVRRVPFGEGTVDFLHAFKVLKNISFHGPFLLEMWAEEDKDNFKVIKESRQWLYEKIKESGYL